MEQFLLDSSKESICVTRLVRLSTSPQSPLYHSKVITSISMSGVTAVVYIGPKAPLLRLFEDVEENTEAGSLQWVALMTSGSDFTREDLMRTGYSMGALTISLMSRHIAEFENFWVMIDPNDPPYYDIWYKEWYMQRNKCRLRGFDKEPYLNYTPCVIPNESQRRSEYTQSEYTVPAILAVFTFARALKDAHQNLCGGRKGLCRELTDLSWNRFYKEYVRYIDFTFASQERVPTLASSGIGPYFRARRVEFDEHQEIMGASYGIWSFSNKSGSSALHQVSKCLLMEHIGL